MISKTKEKEGEDGNFKTVWSDVELRDDTLHRDGSIRLAASCGRPKRGIRHILPLAVAATRPLAGVSVTIQKVGESRDGIRYDVHIDQFVIRFMALDSTGRIIMISKMDVNRNRGRCNIPELVYKAARHAVREQFYIDYPYARIRARRRNPAQLSLL